MRVHTGAYMASATEILPNSNGPLSVSRHSRQMVVMRSMSEIAPAQTLKPLVVGLQIHWQSRSQVTEAGMHFAGNQSRGHSQDRSADRRGREG